MRLQMSRYEMELGGKHLSVLRDSTDIKDDPESLQSRIQEDGYLFIRKLHDPVKVKSARQVILQTLLERGEIDPDYPLDEARIAMDKRGGFMGGDARMTRSPEFLSLVENEELMEFFARFLGAPAMTYDYKWLRIVGHGDFSGIHLDIPYMGRGSKRIYTLWTPLGEVSYEMGPLAIHSGVTNQENYKRLLTTYGEMDVDRDHVDGWFSDNPLEMIELFGGQWYTAEFEPGDALIFGMYVLHGSFNNITNRFRISCDTRYQSADEPIDERWIGEEPIAHYAWGKGEKVTMEQARKQWGI